MKAKLMYWFGVKSKSHHEELISQAHQLGYNRLNDEGICLGVTLSWLSACMVNDKENFSNRIETITSTYNLPTKIELIQKKIMAHTAVTTEELKLLEVLGFYDMVSLYQESAANQAFLPSGKYLKASQANIQRVFATVSSKKLDDRGGLTVNSDDAFEKPYTEQQILTYLNVLAELLAAIHYPSMVGILLTASNKDAGEGACHAMGLTYSPTHQQWVFMDINQWPAIAYERFNTQELVTLIIKGILSPTEMSSKQYNLNIRCIIFNNEPKNSLFTRLLDDITSYGAPNAIIKRASDSEKLDLNKSIIPGHNLIHLAAAYGLTDIIDQIALMDGDLEQMSGYRFNAAYMAAEAGNSDVIAALAKHKVNFNQLSGRYEPMSIIEETAKADINEDVLRLGCNALHVAAHKSFVNVITELAKADKVNLDTLTGSGSSAAHLAAKQGHLPVFIELAKHQANLDLLDSNGLTPYDIANQYGHMAVAAFCLKQRHDQALCEQITADQSAAFFQKHTGVNVAALNQPSASEAVAASKPHERMSAASMKPGLFSDRVQPGTDAATTRPDNVDEGQTAPKHN
ncbi:MAG: ankyrin repeat domain-containing protein [Legionellales bacterium]